MFSGVRLLSLLPYFPLAKLLLLVPFHLIVRDVSEPWYRHPAGALTCGTQYPTDLMMQRCAPVHQVEETASRDAVNLVQGVEERILEVCARALAGLGFALPYRVES
jgi:hypothetical protein